MDDASDRGNPRAPELEDLLNLCAALRREEVRYVLIGGFAVILHGWVRATKDIDLLVDVSVPNVQALKRALSVLPDNAVALIDDGEVAEYSVVRIADEIVVDLMKEACGIDYRAAVEGGVEETTVEGIEIRLASKDLLIRTKQTVRESDAMDVRFLRMKTDEEARARAVARTPGPSEESQGSRSALIAGATGLVGSFLLERLLEEDLYGDIRALMRRPLERQYPKLSEVVANFDQLDENSEVFRVDDVFCCLGTTLRNAGSRAAFRKVDHDYVATIARLARAAGARRFLLVSSLGANAATSNFYLSVKGTAEEAVEACAFPELHVFRPGLLTGPRQEKRFGERAAIFAARLLAPLLMGRLRRFRPIHARTIASAMVGAARAGGAGRQVYMFDDIVRLAGMPAGG